MYPSFDDAPNWSDLVDDDIGKIFVSGFSKNLFYAVICYDTIGSLGYRQVELYGFDPDDDNNDTDGLLYIEDDKLMMTLDGKLVEPYPVEPGFYPRDFSMYNPKGEK